MPHDCRGQLIHVGDVVAIHFRVEQVYEGEEACNCRLRAIAPDAARGESPPELTCNSRFCERPGAP